MGDLYNGKLKCCARIIYLVCYVGKIINVQYQIRGIFAAFGVEIVLNYKSLFTAALISSLAWSATAQTVIKQDTLSFEGCLKVIEITAEQIGAPPKVKVDDDDRRVAEFMAPDGTVVIECDGETEQVTVSIK